MRCRVAVSPARDSVSALLAGLPHHVASPGPLAVRVHSDPQAWCKDVQKGACPLARPGREHELLHLPQVWSQRGNLWRGRGRKHSSRPRHGAVGTGGLGVTVTASFTATVAVTVTLVVLTVTDEQQLSRCGVAAAAVPPPLLLMMLLYNGCTLPLGSTEACPHPKL